jgi:hypothetical protein
MEIKEFAAIVRCAMEREVGRNCTVELQQVKKNNGVVLHGLLIRSQEKNVIPTIYLEPFLEAYEAGAALSDITNRLMGIYRESVPVGKVNMDFFKSFNLVKDRICYRLIGRRGNENLLEEIPYIEFLDLVLCFYYAYQGKALGEGTILVHNSHVEMWGTCTAELLRLAQSNTPRLFPWRCSSLENILEEISGHDTPDVSIDEDPEVSIRVLSNAKRVHGAVCMLYPGVLEKLAAQENVYILPSSVHEVLLLADRGGERADELKNMIAEVNSTQVPPEEVLSDSLYYYDYSEKRVKIIFLEIP